MSVKYDTYLEEHKENVRRAFYWIKQNIPEVLRNDEDYEDTTCWAHDESKINPDEYDAYDRYFYGKKRTKEVEQDFKVAWLKHIHRNPHHWQHWILVNDDEENGIEVLDMPHVYIVEMICDWWSFSWKTGNLHEIFDWYEKHENTMILSDKTWDIVDDILDKIREKLDSMSDKEVK